MADPIHAQRGIRTAVVGILIIAVMISATPPFVEVAHAQDPQPEIPGLLATCGLGQVKSSYRATVVRSSVVMTPGPLFSDGGQFSEHPVDEPCDPGVELGPFPVIAGGTLSARIVGNPPVPNQMSLGNRNSSLFIVYEPLIGGEFGPGEQILALGGQGEDNDVSGEASWSGPGRLRAYIGAPGGSGPLTSVCYEQSYQASAEITEVFPSAPAQPGTILMPGDSIQTDGFGNTTLALPANGTSLWIEPSSDVTLDEPGVAAAPAVLDLPEHKIKLPEKVREFEKASLPMPQGYYDGTSVDFLGRYYDETLQEAYRRIKGLSDPCEAAVELKLFLEANPGQWTARTAGTKARQLATDIALTWLLPNEWNAAEKLAEWALRPVPILGTIANAKNVKDTYDRIMKELVDDASTVRAKRTLAAFEASRGWSLDEVETRKSELLETIDSKEADIRQSRADLEEGIKKLDARLRELKCYDKWDRLANPQVCNAHVGDYQLALRNLEYEHHVRVRKLMAEILEAQTEKRALEMYREPLVKGGCAALKQERPSQEDVCVPKQTTLDVGAGRIRVLHNPLFPSQVINVGGVQVVTKGTELVVEKGEDTSTVTVIEGEVEVTTVDGQVITVSAGQQLLLPAGTLADFDLASDTGGMVSGIPLRELPLDDALPEPYGTYVADFQGDVLPTGWVWQDTNSSHYGPPDATFESPEPGVLRVTVPNENEFWGHRDDAPRLLHKVTGDFDLEGELLLECEGLNHAISEFIIFAPGSSVGYLAGQFYPEDLKSQYLIAGGGWLRYQNLNKLTAVNRPFQDGPDAPDTPVRFKMSRRGDLLKTYWSADDGMTWNLSSRSERSLPETMWVGWLFKRMAYDGLNDVPAVTTLRDVQLRTAPPGTMLEDAWDVVDFNGTVLPFDTELVMTQDGSQPGYVQAYSPWSIPGDFDLTVRFDATPVDSQPGQARYIHVAATSNDEKDHAYVRNAQTPDWHRYDADMEINEGWYRYHYQDTQDSSGRLRLVRQGGIFSGYYWQDGDWVPLSNWNEGFSDPVYLDFRYQWEASAPAPQPVTFTIERLVTPEGEWIGPVDEEMEEQPAEAAAEATPVPRATQSSAMDSLSVRKGCPQAVDPQLAAGWDRERLGCPTALAEATWAAVQPFERGLMLWRGDTQEIIVLVDMGPWLAVADEWRDGVAIPARGQPPSGLVAPLRGFGYLWATDESIFNELGWARWDESGLCAVIQPFEQGVMIHRSDAPECQGQLNPPESGWFGGVDLFDGGAWR